VRINNSGASLAESGVKEWATGQAMDFARRFRVTTEQLKSSEPPALTALRPRLKVMMHHAQSNPDLSHKLEVFGFVEKALANLKAKEDKGERQEG
jgi:hypothetical protein